MIKGQAFKTLQNKKIYVGDKNKEIQDKLLECGFKRVQLGLEEYYLDKTVKFLYIYDEKFRYGSDLDAFFNDPFEQISIKELFEIEIDDFKDGDYVVSPSGSLFILKGKPTIEKTEYYACLTSYDLVIFNCRWNNYNIERLATEKEINKFNSELNKQGNTWNPDTKKIEDKLKIGDICIFWNESHTKAVISKLVDIIGCYFITNAGHKYTNAIKFKSIEYYNNFSEYL